MLAKIFHIFLLLLFSTLSVDPLVQDVYWRDFTASEIPKDAIEAAPRRYIGLVSHDGFLVGTIFPDSGTMSYIYYIRKTTRSNIKILCSRKQHRLYWEKVNFAQPHRQQMTDAVKGGFGVSWNSPLFIGKTQHEGEWKVGLVFDIAHPIWAGLWVWTTGGVAALVKEFYMLKYNSTEVENDYEYECANGSTGRNASIWETFAQT